MTLVMIEDNRETAFLVDKALENTEFQLVQAYDTKTGLDFVARANPVAVILDVFVDGESSWETLKLVRERRLPVLMVSVMGSEKAKAMAMGANAFLQKPVSRDALLKTLRSLTHRGTLRKVLLIDDNELARYSLGELLSANVEIIEARSGREGLRLAFEDPPDAIFLDLKMPDMSGFEVFQELRLSNFGREIPVIIHSSRELTEQEKVSLQLSFVTVLAKRETSGPDALERVNQALLSVGFSMETAEEKLA
jgi:DNA-binding response OmpR family regulator